MKFTTSWDDGYALDLRAADILTRHGATGTFYICPKSQHRQAMLTESDIVKLSKQHEIGAHSLTHPRLTILGEKEAKAEIAGSKRWVENITGKPCVMFCYPYGDENASVRELVRRAGFRGARTVEDFAFSLDDPFNLPTTLQLYPYPLRPVLHRGALQPLRRAWPHLRALGVPLTAHRSWLSMAKVLFRFAHAHGKPWFHLWGHSAEVEQYGMWQALEDFLELVAKHRDVDYVPNSSLLQ